MARDSEHERGSDAWTARLARSAERGVRKAYHLLPLDADVRWRAKVVLGSLFGWAVRDTDSYRKFVAEREARRARARANAGGARALPPPPIPVRTQRAWDAAPAGLPQDLRALRVATILDEFSWQCFSPECDMLQLRPQELARQLDEFRPQLVLVESAWMGVDDLWQRKVNFCERELVELLEWCRAAGVPAAFWNKEDPLHFDAFIETARLFDLIFTTDLGRIGDYKQVVGHEDVYLLPFAVQPALHDPLERYERKRCFGFAGSYYASFPERQRDLRTFAATLADLAGFDIWDRRHGADDPNYNFPKDLRGYVRGGLPFEGVDRAYKGYDFAVNLNSIKDSSTMFARRVFELLGSNTPVVSNDSVGIRTLFGDLVIATDDAGELRRRLAPLLADEHAVRNLRLRALRKVLREHTYRERVAFIAGCAFERTWEDVEPPVLVLSAVESAADVDRARANFARQEYAARELVLVARGDLSAPALSDGEQWIRADEAEASDLRELCAGRALAGMRATDYYGPNYLVDLALARRFTQAPVVGKAAYYVQAQSGVVLEHDERAYRSTETLASARAWLQPAAIPDETVADWAADLVLGRERPYADAVALDVFGYCAQAEMGVAAKADVSSARHVDSSTAKEADSSVARQAGASAARRDASIAREAGASVARKADASVARKADASVVAVVDDRPLVDEGASLAELNALAARARPGEPTHVPRSRVLLVTNRYPEHGDLYHNVFVHARVAAYRRRGVLADVLRFDSARVVGYHEFEGVRVWTGHAAELDAALATGEYEHVLVHFLQPDMWSVLEQHLASVSLTVWLHGFEVQAPERRDFSAPRAREVVQARWERVRPLWRDVFTRSAAHLQFVFVSDYLRRCAEEDLGVTLPAGRTHVIPNPVDTDFFAFMPKDASARRRILSIRPYASRAYANDLTVQAILELAREDFFDELQFTLVGDGELFEQTTAPLRGFANVTLRRAFLTKPEIRDLYADHGVCLIPSRMDTHGVARDEAMAAGLVPVTTRVAAIPEFVDEDCGVLVEPEDARALAAGVAGLVRDPETFERLSRAAAARVREQAGAPRVLPLELALFGGR